MRKILYKSWWIALVSSKSNQHIWTFLMIFWIALKVWLNICSQTCVPLETLIENLQSNLHTPWNFNWKFAVKLSYPPESLVESLQSNFHTPLESLHWKFQSNFHTPLKVCNESFNETFNLIWITIVAKMQGWKFQLKLSRGPETFNANFQGGMKVWLQTFNQTFRGVWKFDCKFSTKLSYHIEIGIVFPPKKVESLVQTHLHPFGQLPFLLMDEAFAGFD